MFFQSRDETNSLMIAASIVQVCIVLGIALNMCEVGQRWSDAYLEIIDRIDQFDWYLCPMNVQRMLPILLIVAQQPVKLRMTGSTSTNRDTFKKVR